MADTGDIDDLVRGGSPDTLVLTPRRRDAREGRHGERRPSPGEALTSAHVALQQWR